MKKREAEEKKAADKVRVQMDREAKKQKAEIDRKFRETKKAVDEAISMRNRLQEFQDANQNARMALLNQLSTVDKDKQTVPHAAEFACTL